MNRAIYMYREGGYQARKIGKSHTTLTGRLPATKDQLFKTFESPLERDFLVILDFDWDVEAFYDQPVQIPFVGSDGRNHTYTPDVLVFYRRDRKPACWIKPLLVEIKKESDLAKNGSEYEEKFAAAKLYAEERGWEFRVLTEKDIRTPFLKNANFLRPFRNRERHPWKEKLLMDTLEILDETTPEALLAEAMQFRRANPDLLEILHANDAEFSAMLLPSLWQLVDSGMIAIDLQLPLSMTSEIWMPDVD